MRLHRFHILCISYKVRNNVISHEDYLSRCFCILVQSDLWHCKCMTVHYSFTAITNTVEIELVAVFIIELMYFDSNSSYNCPK